MTARSEPRAGTGAIPRRVRVRPRPDSGPPARVSVVVPLYNYAEYLPGAVRSALDQEGVDVDVVVVDDASTDGGGAVADRLARESSRVRVLHHSGNLGPVATFNDGLALTEGEFLVRLDADDLLTPGSLTRSVAVARAFPSVGLVYGHPIHVSTQSMPRARTRPRSWTVWPGRQWLEARCRLPANVITSPEVLMRASVVDRVGGQRPLAHTHDMEMWMRIAAFSDVAHIEGADQAWHRDHPASLSAGLGAVTILEERRDAFDVLFGEAAIEAGDRLHDLARRQLAREALDRACHEYDRGRGRGPLVADLVSFAAETQHGFTELPEWGRLERRRRLGPERVPRRPWYLAQAVSWRLAGVVEHRYWRTWGVYRRE